MFSSPILEKYPLGVKTKPVLLVSENIKQKMSSQRRGTPRMSRSNNRRVFESDVDEALAPTAASPQPPLRPQGMSSKEREQSPKSPTKLDNSFESLEEVRLSPTVPSSSQPLSDQDDEGLYIYGLQDASEAASTNTRQRFKVKSKKFFATMARKVGHLQPSHSTSEIDCKGNEDLYIYGDQEDMNGKTTKKRLKFKKVKNMLKGLSHQVLGTSHTETAVSGGSTPQLSSSLSTPSLLNNQKIPTTTSPISPNTKNTAVVSTTPSNISSFEASRNKFGPTASRSASAQGRRSDSVNQFATSETDAESTKLQNIPTSTTPTSANQNKTEVASSEIQNLSTSDANKNRLRPAVSRLVADPTPKGLLASRYSASEAASEIGKPIWLQDQAIPKPTSENHFQKDATSSNQRQPSPSTATKVLDELPPGVKAVRAHVAGSESTKPLLPQDQGTTRSNLENQVQKNTTSSDQRQLSSPTGIKVLGPLPPGEKAVRAFVTGSVPTKPPLSQDQGIPKPTSENQFQKDTTSSNQRQPSPSTATKVLDELPPGDKAVRAHVAGSESTKPLLPQMVEIGKAKDMIVRLEKILEKLEVQLKEEQDARKKLEAKVNAFLHTDL